MYFNRILTRRRIGKFKFRVQYSLQFGVGQRRNQLCCKLCKNFRCMVNSFLFIFFNLKLICYRYFFQAWHDKHRKVHAANQSPDINIC